MSRELLFSVTASDCLFNYYRGTGAGGQKRNKTSSAVRCTHKDSEAVGQSDDTRSQHTNKQIAFGRMARTKKFKSWQRLEAARKTGALAKINKKVEKSLQPRYIVVEGKEDGKWVKLADAT